MSNEENVIAHYGILGMKWGVRRYQNPDGSLTAAGRQHYKVGSAKNSSQLSDEEKQAYIKSKNIEKNYQKALTQDRDAVINAVRDAANNTSSNLNNAKNAYSEYKKSKLPAVNTDSLTTRELQEAVTRMNLEDNYKRLMQNRQLAKQGKDWVELTIDSLDEVADLAKIAASVATVIAIAKRMTV